MSYKDQSGDGRIGFMGKERPDTVFTEAMRREATSSLDRTASFEQVLATKLALSSHIMLNAAEGMEAHQGLFFLAKLQHDRPEVPNLLYDDLVGRGCMFMETNPDLAKRILSSAGIEYYSHCV